MNRHASLLPSRDFAGWIGAARADITPPTGIAHRNWGAAVHTTSEGVHRPLTATALTLQETPAHPPLILIAADLGWWKSAEDEHYVRGFVLERLGLDTSQLMIALSHTHAGPSLCRADIDHAGGDLVAPYLDFLRETFVRITAEALQNSGEALLTWRYGRCGLASNRDLPDPAADRFLCGWNPAAPADDTLLVGRVVSGRYVAGQGFIADAGDFSLGRSCRIRATLVNYACHPTTLAWENRLISPDFAGAMRQTVESATSGAPCLFLNGAAGELAPREEFTADVGVADRHGCELGYAALSVLTGMGEPGKQLEYTGVVESGAPLALWAPKDRRPDRTLQAVQIDVPLPVKPDFPTMTELDSALKETLDSPLHERLFRKRFIRAGIGETAVAVMPCWIWRIGGAILLGHPNEAYSMLQTELRDRFRDMPVGVMNVVNGHFGYLPPADFYDRDLYAVWQTPFDRGALEKIIRTAGEAIERMGDD